MSDIVDGLVLERTLTEDVLNTSKLAVEVTVCSVGLMSEVRCE